jgi:hypothetical protein
LRIAVTAMLLAAGPAGAVPLTVMFERNDNGNAGQELAFISFPSFDALIGDVGGSTSFSQINVNAAFNTTGLTFDGSNYIVMFERIDNGDAGQELAFISFPSFDALIGDVGGSTSFSQINVNAAFNTTGLMAQVDFGGGEPPPPPVPLPPALALLLAGMAGLAGAGLRGRRTPAG